MGRLGPLTSQGLGRSPYDDVVPGEGVEDPRTPHQLYDERGRPINPETKRINRDVIRSHNEVMMVIGVAEPENGVADAQLEAARRHHQYEETIGRRLQLTGGVLETAAIWGINGMRQRILLYKPYSQTNFYGMFRLAWSQQSMASYFFGGLPSFVASTLLEQLAAPKAKKYPVIQYATSYIRLHLAIYTFFQRTGIVAYSSLLPNWRFFIPGTSLSPIPLPSLPTSFRPQSLLQWLGAMALGVTPFAGFYLYTKFYSLVTKTLRVKIYRFLPRPYNAHKRRVFPETAALPPGAELVPIEVRTEEPVDDFPSASATNSPSPDGPHRRQSTASLRGSNSALFGEPGAAPPHDDFASDDEETEIISATLISFDVEATDPTTPLDPSAPNSSSANPNSASANDNTPGVWSAELRPNLAEGARPGGGPGSGAGGLFGGGGAGGANEPVYRENMLTRLPAVLATDMLAITPARLLMTPFAAAVWLGLAGPYMARQAGGGGLMAAGDVVQGVGRWWGLWSGAALKNMLGLEMLLALIHGEAWALLTIVAETFRFSEEEWCEREGVGLPDEGAI
ncbi:hypothetical protein C8A05DRAFT_31930 [Staphylotrichum tortipilum]|uniref:Uncharacterized protein n=1 Tax=Staphylotrichum tortipilum TaxID=2831512 RepID=A0AAN6MQS8_9PEZI|nr:hypothetical protein C8A05DRAFT_31930 [Staphylotrichum longicolle]